MMKQARGEQKDDTLLLSLLDKRYPRCSIPIAISVAI